MRFTLVIAALLLFVTIPVRQEAPAAAQGAPALSSDKAKLSYALGMDLGRQLREKKVDLDPVIFTRGLGDTLSGGTTLLTEEEGRTLVTALQDDVQRRQYAQIAQRADANKKSAEAFLSANRVKEGVTTLPSGLQYRILEAGTGRKPTLDDTVTCHYRGTLTDGTEFDSSYARGEPASFPVKGVIKGWTEALQLMSVGSKWQVFIPAELAYGSRGAGSRIPPNAALVFEVALIAIK